MNDEELTEMLRDMVDAIVSISENVTIITERLVEIDDAQTEET